MRLGSVIYMIPFVFVLEPSFILAGDGWQTIQAVAEALLGIWLMAGALQGFLPGVGLLSSLVARSAVGFGGLAIALPDLTLAWADGPLNAVHLIAGIVLAAAGLVMARLRNAPAAA